MRLADAWGQVLRESRESLGWTQTKLAEVSGRTRQQVNIGESGHSAPNLRTVFVYAQAVGLHPWQLVKRVEVLLREDNPVAWLEGNE